MAEQAPKPGDVERMELSELVALTSPERLAEMKRPALSRLILEHLRGCGYSVEHNHPYKGVELVRRYGDPARQRHSVQLEINRRLYMNEETLALEPAGFARLRADLQALVQQLLVFDPR